MGFGNATIAKAANLSSHVNLSLYWNECIVYRQLNNEKVSECACWWVSSSPAGTKICCWHLWGAWVSLHNFYKFFFIIQITMLDFSLTHSLFLSHDSKMCYVCDSKVIKNPMYANQCFSHPIAHQYSTRKSKFQIEFCVMNMWTSPFFAYLMTCLSSFLLLLLQPLLTTLFPYTNPPSMPLMCSFLLLFGKTHEICSMNYRIFDWLAITLPPTHISCLNFWLFSKDFCDKGRKFKTLSQYKNLNCRKIDFLFVFLD